MTQVQAEERAEARAAPRTAKRVNIIVFSGEMDRVLAAFNIAIGAVSMGMEVNMFFTFWGLNVVKKNEGRIKSKGIMRKMLNMMNRGGSKRLPLSRFHMFGLGKWMMGRLMKDVNFPNVEELMQMAHSMGVKFITCNTTLALMGVTQEAVRPEVSDCVGATTFLSLAEEGSVNLFI